VSYRFTEIMASLEDRTSANQVSIGALQSIDVLRRVLVRSTAEIEYTSSDSRSAIGRTFKSTPKYWETVSTTVARRRPTSQELESLEGRVTALDTVRSELQLSMPGLKERVRGSFPSAFHPELMRSLGRQVRLFGLIDWREGEPRLISIQFAELLDIDEE
jgi:hypothetical protein